MMKHDLSGRFWTETLEINRRGERDGEGGRGQLGLCGLLGEIEAFRSGCISSQRDPEASKGSEADKGTYCRLSSWLLVASV